jgi:hypothetical protein
VAVSASDRIIVDGTKSVIRRIADE